MKVITIKVEKNQQQKYCEISPIFPLNEIIKKKIVHVELTFLLSNISSKCCKHFFSI